jgi:hypothetical protein
MADRGEVGPDLVGAPGVDPHPQEVRPVVLNKMGGPIVLEQAQQDLEGLIARLEDELFEIRGEET